MILFPSKYVSLAIYKLLLKSPNINSIYIPMLTATQPCLVNQYDIKFIS